MGAKQPQRRPTGTECLVPSLQPPCPIIYLSTFTLNFPVAKLATWSQWSQVARRGHLPGECTGGSGCPGPMTAALVTPALAGAGETMRGSPQAPGEAAELSTCIFLDT